jgi:hypothetical protein
MDQELNQGLNQGLNQELNQEIKIRKIRKMSKKKQCPKCNGMFRCLKTHMNKIVCCTQAIWKQCEICGRCLGRKSWYNHYNRHQKLTFSIQKGPIFDIRKVPKNGDVYINQAVLSSMIRTEDKIVSGKYKECQHCGKIILGGHIGEHNKSVHGIIIEHTTVAKIYRQIQELERLFKLAQIDKDLFYFRMKKLNKQYDSASKREGEIELKLNNKELI